MKVQQTDRAKTPNRAARYVYLITVLFLTLSGFGQMPIFKRYYIADIPGFGWLAQFYVTHYIHYGWNPRIGPFAGVPKSPGKPFCTGIHHFPGYRPSGNGHDIFDSRRLLPGTQKALGYTAMSHRPPAQRAACFFLPSAKKTGGQMRDKNLLIYEEHNYERTFHYVSNRRNLDSSPGLYSA
jgi:hypothetical protein